MLARAVVYERRRPEATTLYEVVQDNLATLYGAVEDGAVSIALPKFVRKEREGYLDCGLLCRSFARVETQPARARRVSRRWLSRGGGGASSRSTGSRT